MKKSTYTGSNIAFNRLPGNQKAVTNNLPVPPMPVAEPKKQGTQLEPGAAA
jgi:hypothetical protein